MTPQRTITLFFLLLTGITVCCQTAKNKFVGKYSDDISELIIKADSTFELSTPDYVFPYTYKTYQTRGTWIDSGNVLTLNPGKEKRQPGLSLMEKEIKGSDSIQIKINYLTEVYENELLVNKTPADFNLMTLYINNTKNYRHLVHTRTIRVCAFAPRVKHQVVVDSSNIVQLPKQKIQWLGIYTYGFEEKVELVPSNPNANYFEITIVQPVDKERTPRSKKVVIKGNHAYYYELNGRIPTSGVLLDGLKRVE